MRYIDNTQYSAWLNCPLYWYEKFYKGYQKVQEGQSGGALTLGSMTHKALENYYKNGVVEIDTKVIERLQPTPECFNNAITLANAWVRTRAGEQWGVVAYEEALTFKLSYTVSWQGLAKLDTYWLVERETSIDDGLGGSIVLKPGYWIRDYKTSSAQNRSNVIKSWACNMQADFQMLALGEKVGVENIVGMLVGVIEKPREYIPKRTCKGCKQQYEFSMYVPVESKYKCGWCGYLQELTPLSKPTGYTKDPDTYYIRVDRTAEDLEVSKKLISGVTFAMDNFTIDKSYLSALIDGYGAINTLRCVDMIYGECEFYNAHVAPGLGVNGNSRYIKADTLGYMKSNV